MVRAHRNLKAHRLLRRVATGLNLTVRKAVALAPKNDPFFAGLEPNHVEKAKWIAKLWKGMGLPAKVHIRRLHYWLISQRRPVRKPNGMPYRNTVQDWNYLQQACGYARYLGYVPFEVFVDRRNPEPTIHAYYWSHEDVGEMLDKADPEDVAGKIAKEFYWVYNPQLEQPYHLEVWQEKNTLTDVILPVCQRFGANLVTGLGELSIPRVYELIQRIAKAEKPARILYISDFDPHGTVMPVSIARKVEWFVRTAYPKMDVRLRPLLLTREQCTEYKLPRTPIKSTDPLKDAWEERHGEGATELDALEALHPGEAARILEEALKPYFDEELKRQVLARNQRIMAAVYGEILDVVEEALEDMDRDHVQEVASGFEMPEAEPVKDEGEWLYDSGLRYREQLSRFKRYQGRGLADEEVER